jgi:hypothetical protein
MKTTALLTLLLACASAHADDGLLRCRQIPQADARLACYDSLPAAAPAPAPAPSPVATFGMESKVKPEQVDAIESNIVGWFDGWHGGQLLTLANGQVWRITDDDQVATRMMENPKVKITRGMLGAMYLEIEGSNASPKVKRVR